MNSERGHVFLIAAWRDGTVDLLRLSEEHFQHARATWVGQGFHNLQSEWFERQLQGTETLFHVRLFVYWEAPDDAPSMEQIFEWVRRVPSCRSPNSGRPVRHTMGTEGVSDAS